VNKFIADFFSELISLVHILAIGGFCWYLISEKPWQQGQSALIFTVLAFCGYVAVTGLLSTFIAMNENIVELKKEIKENIVELKKEIKNLNSNQGSEINEFLSDLKIEVVTQLEAIALESATISSSVESVASDTSEITSLINLEAGSLNEAIQNLSNSAKNLGQSVSTLNHLLNQDWFRKLILK
jgi:hypothetical protein